MAKQIRLTKPVRKSVKKSVKKAKARKISTVADVREFSAGIIATDDVKIILSDTVVDLVYQGRGFTWSRSTGELIGESNTPVDETTETTEQASEAGMAENLDKGDVA